MGGCWLSRKVAEELQERLAEATQAQHSSASVAASARAEASAARTEVQAALRAAEAANAACATIRQQSQLQCADDGDDMAPRDLPRHAGQQPQQLPVLTPLPAAANLTNDDGQQQMQVSLRLRTHGRSPSRREHCNGDSGCGQNSSRTAIAGQAPSELVRELQVNCKDYLPLHRSFKFRVWMTICITFGHYIAPKCNQCCCPPCIGVYLHALLVETYLKGHIRFDIKAHFYVDC